MYLTYCKKPILNRQKKVLFDLLYSFKESGEECAKIENVKSHYSSIKSAQNTIAMAIRHYKFTDITVNIIKDELYLIRH